MIRRLALLLGGLLALAPLASARAEENGIKIGDGRLHPYFDLEGRYDTAAQVQYDPATNTSSGLGDFILHFRPGLKLSVPSPDFAVDLGANVDYLVYLGLNTHNASSLDRLQSEANLDLGILRGSAVSFDIGDHFNRSDQSTNVSLPVGLLALYNDARASVQIAPGGGALTVTPGYHFMLETYAPLANASVTGGNVSGGVYSTPSDFNYIQHRFTLENRWRFLPKTALMLDGEYDARSYSNTGPGNVNLNFFTASTGVSGLVTPHLAMVLRVGYARDLSAAASFSSVIGQAEATYVATETTSLRLGFLRQFQPVSAPYVSYEDDRGYLEGRLTAIGRLTLHLYGAADLLNFNVVQGSGAQARSDVTFTLAAGLDYEVTRWLIASVGDQFNTRSSDLKAGGATDPNAPLYAGLNLTSDQAYVRLTFTY